MLALNSGISKSGGAQSGMTSIAGADKMSIPRTLLAAVALAVQEVVVRVAVAMVGVGTAAVAMVMAGLVVVGMQVDLMAVVVLAALDKCRTPCTCSARSC